MVFLACLFVSITLFCLWYYIKFNERITLAKKLPGPEPLPIVGNALRFLKKSPGDLMKSIEATTKTYGRMTRILLGPQVQVLTTDPLDAEIILGSQKLINKSDEYGFMAPWLGDGLLVGSGQKWFQRRRIITPTFHFKILEQFVEVFNKHGSIFVDKLEKLKDQSVDVWPILTLCTLDVICESAMGVEIGAQTDSGSAYVKAVTEITNIIESRRFNVFLRNDILFSLSSLGRRQKAVLKILHSFTDSVIFARRKEILNKSNELETKEDDDIGSKKRMALLDVLLQSTINGQPLTNLEIREEVDTFIAAGHDTTKAGISFTLYSLANNPEVQRKAFEEVRAVLGDADKIVTQKDLNDLHYLDLVIKESLRMHPPIPWFARKASENVEINGKIIPKGTNVVVSPFLMGRDETLWKDASKFIPERFEVGDQKLHPYLHIPFSAGPRNCIGQKFAVLEMKSVIAKTLLHFEVEVAPNYEPIIAFAISVKTSNGVHLVFRKRDYD